MGRKWRGRRTSPRRTRVRRRVALGVAVVALAAVVVSVSGDVRGADGRPSFRSSAGSAQQLAQVPVAHPDPGVLGVYAGYTNLAGVQAVATMLGRPVTQAMDFFDGTNWSSIEHSPANEVPKWSGYQMTWSVPMLPQSGASLRVGATGAYDSHFAAVADYLVANGQADAIIRLGWEFNGNWFPWSAGNCLRCFVEYWRQIVQTMRAVPGAGFRFEWAPAASITGFPFADAYPGNNWVDIVGLDIYDMTMQATDPADRWQVLLTETVGLDWLAGFAAAHHKPIGLPEWGLGWGPAGGGDNPYYILQMAHFIASHDVVSAIYWNYASSSLQGAPQARKAFVAAFG